MAQMCREQLSQTAVNILCYTTECPLALTDQAQHITQIENNRSGSIYMVEIFSTTLAGLVSFNGSTKSITRYGIIGARSMAPITIVVLNPLNGPGQEEIMTTIEFYNSSQRLGNGTFIGPKESYQIDYEMLLT